MMNCLIISIEIHLTHQVKIYSLLLYTFGDFGRFFSRSAICFRVSRATVLSVSADLLRRAACLFMAST